MKLINELLNYPHEPENRNCYLFTSNHTIKANGELVMGRGNALAFKKAYPGSPTYFANELKFNEQPIMTALQGDGVVGSFQTKDDWRKPSTVELIQASTDMLLHLAMEHTYWTFHLPCPGISNGGLSYEDVEPIINKLPDNVLIYKV